MQIFVHFYRKKTPPTPHRAWVLMVCFSGDGRVMVRCLVRHDWDASITGSSSRRNGKSGFRLEGYVPIIWTGQDWTFLCNFSLVLSFYSLSFSKQSLKRSASLYAFIRFLFFEQIVVNGHKELKFRA